VITQRLILDGGTWTCIGCHGPLDEGIIQHPHDCPELRQGGMSGPLPSPAQVCAWLGVHSWAMIGTGEGGSAWQPPGSRGRDSWVGIPDGAGDVHALAGALERIASRSGLPFGEVLAGMRATEVGESSDG
jgi:hypothetical protein